MGAARGLLCRPRVALAPRQLHSSRHPPSGGERHEPIGAVAVVVMPRPIAPDPALLIPFLAVVTQALQARRATRLVEVAGRKDIARGLDSLALVGHLRDDGRPEPHFFHHRQPALGQEFVLPGAVVWPVVLIPFRIVVALPVAQPANVVGDVLPALLIIADEAMRRRDMSANDYTIAESERRIGVEKIQETTS